MKTLKLFPCYLSGCRTSTTLGLQVIIPVADTSSDSFGKLSHLLELVYHFLINQNSELCQHNS